MERDGDPCEQYPPRDRLAYQPGCNAFLQTAEAHHCYSSFEIALQGALRNLRVQTEAGSTLGPTGGYYKPQLYYWQGVCMQIGEGMEGVNPS